MPRLTLSSNYVLNQGNVIESFGNVSDWAVVTDNDGTAVNDPVIYKTGSQSIKLSVTNNGASRYVYATKTGLSFKILPKTIYLWVYVHSDVGIVGQILCYLGAIGSLTSSYRSTWPYNYNGVLAHSIVPGWNKLVMHRDGMDTIGTPSWNNTQTTVRVRVNSASGTGQVASVSFGYLGYDEECSTRCIFTADGARRTVHDRMFPILSRAGIRGTCFITQANVGIGYYMNLTELHALYDAGWTIGNHTVTHPNFATMTQAQIEAEITPCTSYLIAQGFTRTAKYFAYPNGIITAAGLAAVANTGILVSRTTYRGFCYGGHNNQVVTGYVLSNGTGGQLNITTQNVRDILDLIVKYGGGTIIFYLDGLYDPDLGESPVDPFEQPISYLQEIVDYIVLRKIQCVTMEEWYKGLTDPRYRALPLTRTAADIRTTVESRTSI